MLQGEDYMKAVKRLEQLSKRAEELLNGITADNITQRIRERNAVMIQATNLKRKLQEKQTTVDVMDYGIVEFKQKR